MPPKKNIILNELQAKVESKLNEILNKRRKRGFFAKISRFLGKRGVYLYGGVGSGKSMLMGAFYEKVSKESKLYHFQNFIRELHLYNHMHSLDPVDPPLVKMAKEYVSSGVKYIFIDELEITDVTDATVVSVFLYEVTRRGIFLFFTSNSSPKELYKGIVGKDSFAPFIEYLSKNFDLFDLSFGIDYRKQTARAISRNILYPEDEKNIGEIEKITKKLLGQNLFKASRLALFGREVIFKKTLKDLLVTDGAELFGRDLGYSDYVTICQRFPIIVLKGVDKISGDDTNLAVRFINFIDQAYFNKVLLFALLPDSPENLYSEGKKSEDFKRSISRLYEMSGSEYKNLCGKD